MAERPRPASDGATRTGSTWIVQPSCTKSITKSQKHGEGSRAARVFSDPDVGFQNLSLRPKIFQTVATRQRRNDDSKS